MVAEKRRKKRVRIQPGHEERLIEKRKSRRRIVKKSKMRRSKPNSSTSTEKVDQQLKRITKTHQPTVSQLVYQFLEKASNRDTCRTMKGNATKQFKKLQRKTIPKRLKPGPSMRKPCRCLHNEIGRKLPSKEKYVFPFHGIPSNEGKRNLEKCIFEVLTYGTVLGLLEPADKQGMVFRISSDLGLFQEQKATGRRNLKRKIEMDNYRVPSKRRHC